MEFLIIILGAFFGTGLLVRSVNCFYIRKQFKQPFEGVPRELTQTWANHRIWQFASKNTVEVSAAGLNTEQALYHLSQIDDRVLQAIDRIHDPSSVNSYHEILAHITEKHDQGVAVWEGAINNYKGTLGETMLAENLRASGHVVEMAHSASQEGWDAIVDGEKVNFKAGLDTGHIQHHLERFPHIPVVTVSEQADNFAGNPDVICLHDVSGEHIAQVTDHAMSSAVEMGDFNLHIPLITLAVSSVRNFTPVFRGNSDLATAAKYTAADTAGVGFGAAAGAKAGALFGSLGGPLGAAAGAIIGGIGGVIGGKYLARNFKETDLRAAITIIDNRFADYSKAYIAGLHQKAHALEQGAKKLKNKWSLYSLIAPTPGDVMRSDMRKAYRRWANFCRDLAKILDDKAVRLDDSSPNYTLLGREIISNPPAETIYSRELSSCLERIKNALEQIEKEKQKLGYA